MSSKDLGRLRDQMRPGEIVADTVARLGGYVEEAIEEDLDDVQEILDMIGEATSVIEGWCERDEVQGIAEAQAKELRHEAEWLVGYVETFIEKALPEQMADN